MQAELFHDLHDTGLYSLAESWGVINDVSKLLKGIPYQAQHAPFLPTFQLPHADISAYLQPMSAKACAQPAPMQAELHPEPSPIPQAQQAQPVQEQPLNRQASCSASAVQDESTRQANEAADAAAAASVRTIDRARQVIQDVTILSNARNKSGSSSTQQSSGRRKSGRISGDGTVRCAQAGQAGTTAGKGLRHFALMVCEQVREHGRTTYNDVADALVAKLTSECVVEGKDVPDDKTIRRRVYDALNVLMAMDIIQREKKDIIWRGLPSELGNAGGAAATGVSPDALNQLRQERLRRISDVDRKQTFLQELVEQHATLKQLIARNASQQHKGGTEIHLPFILIQAKPDATVEVKISDDMQDVQFDIYDSQIQVHDDSGVLKLMGSHNQQLQALVKEEPAELSLQQTTGLKPMTPNTPVTDVLLGSGSGSDPMPIA